MPPVLLDSVVRTGLTVDLPPVETHIIKHDSAVEGILRAAKPEMYDLLVLIARQRSFMSSLFHRSVTAQVLLRSELPVLVLPAH
jgi:nucleotide-binding universal stress UspA family protein